MCVCSTLVLCHHQVIIKHKSHPLVTQFVSLAYKIVFAVYEYLCLFHPTGKVLFYSLATFCKYNSYERSQALQPPGLHRDGTIGVLGAEVPITLPILSSAPKLLKISIYWWHFHSLFFSAYSSRPVLLGLFFSACSSANLKGVVH